jgi:hypothetical protein
MDLPKTTLCLLTENTIQENKYLKINRFLKGVYRNSFRMAWKASMPDGTRICKKAGSPWALSRFPAVEAKDGGSLGSSCVYYEKIFKTVYI